MVIFHSYVSLPEGIQSAILWCQMVKSCWKIPICVHQIPIFVVIWFFVGEIRWKPNSLEGVFLLRPLTIQQEGQLWSRVRKSGLQTVPGNRRNATAILWWTPHPRRLFCTDPRWPRQCMVMLRIWFYNEWATCESSTWNLQTSTTSGAVTCCWSPK